jgi:hypothetical protein
MIGIFLQNFLLTNPSPMVEWTREVMVKKKHKTSASERKDATAYYWAHRAERLAYGEAYRRAKGVQKHTPAMTRDERLAAVMMCKRCGKQIVTPTLLLQRQHVCLRCRNPEHFTTAAARERSRQHRASLTGAHGRFWAWKRQQVCADCGKAPTKDTPLDLHHRDPSTKLFKVSRGLHQVSAARLWAEVDKCDVLCKDCHALRH